ncbi:hypothetical protein ACIRFH_04255 [Streptomyces sp. NPDC093586]|uniref:hypothetical protein n=1 Tax=Streptomyces sp. NPDC093586 TaxID=3366042 RepID=UPI0037FDB1CF
MMHQHAPAARICRDCDGFPTVAITTGTRNGDGTRATCPTCQGTGTTRPTAAFARSGK